MLFQNGVGQVDDVTTFVVLDHLQRLTPGFSGITAANSRVHDIAVGNGGLLGDFIQCHLVRAVYQELDDFFLPVRPVRQQTQIGERFLRATQLLLYLRQLVRELDEHPPVSFSLMLRQR